jgi:hypothetical protein
MIPPRREGIVSGHAKVKSTGAVTAIAILTLLIVVSGCTGQIQELVKTVYRGDVEIGTLSRPVRWDMKRNMHTFLEGTTLPDASEKEKRKRR